MADEKADQKLSVRETAEMLGLSVKATQQAIFREAFPNIEREEDEKTGRTKRVWIPRSDVIEYARKRRISLAVVGDPPFSTRRAVSNEPNPPWRTVLDQLQRENLDLRLRLAEAEQEIARLRGGRPSQ